MPGPNTLGTPNTDDYNLGRGIIYFAVLDPTTDAPLYWRDMGNAPAFTISADSETLQHFSSREGLKTLDREVTLQRTLNLSFTLDEWNDENLAALFSATQTEPTNGSVAGFTEYEMVAPGDALGGRWYDVVNSSGVRCYDVDSAKLVIKTTAGSPVTLVEDTDYTMDNEMGRFFLISTAARIITMVTAGEGLDVTLTAKAGASDIYKIASLAETEINGAIKFISSNAADDGSRREFTIHKVSLKADGDVAMIGDDWGEMPFTAAAEQNADGDTMTIISVAA
jgi:hypothetical protein